jgi:hypothetical protein
MAKFLFISDGQFVNMDEITNIRVAGASENTESVEIWFVGNTAKTSGLFLHGSQAKEFLDEFLRTHDVVGYPKPEPRV